MYIDIDIVEYYGIHELKVWLQLEIQKMSIYWNVRKSFLMRCWNQLIITTLHKLSTRRAARFIPDFFEVNIIYLERGIKQLMLTVSAPNCFLISYSFKLQKCTLLTHLGREKSSLLMSSPVFLVKSFQTF